LLHELESAALCTAIIKIKFIASAVSADANARWWCQRAMNRGNPQRLEDGASAGKVVSRLPIIPADQPSKAGGEPAWLMSDVGRLRRAFHRHLGIPEDNPQSRLIWVRHGPFESLGAQAQLSVRRPGMVERRPAPQKRERERTPSFWGYAHGHRVGTHQNTPVSGIRDPVTL